MPPGAQGSHFPVLSEEGHKSLAPTLWVAVSPGRLYYHDGRGIMQSGIQGPVAARVHWSEKSVDPSKGPQESAFKYLPVGDETDGCTVAYPCAPCYSRPGQMGFQSRHVTWAVIRGDTLPAKCLIAERIAITPTQDVAILGEHGD